MVGLHESHTLSVMCAHTEDDRLLCILLPTIDSSITCPFCTNTTFHDIGPLYHHFQNHHKTVPISHDQFECLRDIIWRDEIFGDWSIEALWSTKQMLTVEYWTWEYIEDLAMSTSGEFATLAYLQTMTFLPVDAIDFGGAAEHNEDLSNIKIKEQTAVMEELDECMTSLLLPAFQHPTQQYLSPPPSNNHLYLPELTCNSLCFIQHPEQCNLLILICMKCETALNIIHSTILEHCHTTTH